MRPIKAISLEGCPSRPLGSSNAAGPGQARGPDALATRTSSSAPAPRSPLERLPNDLLGNILGRLVTGSPFESVRNLSAVMQTSVTLRQSVVGDPALWSNDQKLGAVNQAVIESVGQAVTEFADRIGDLLVDERARHCRSLLQFLPTAQRDSLVDAVLELPDGMEKATAISQLGSALALLEKTRRDALVAATLQLPDARDKALAIGGLSGLDGGLVHLEPPQRHALAAAAISLRAGPDWKSLVLVGLAAGLAALKPPQSDDLVDAVLGLPDELLRAVAIGKFGQALEHLDKSRRNTVVNAVISLRGDEPKATAITGLGAGLEYLNPQQRGALVELAIDLSDDHKAQAIAGLGAGLKALRLRQRDALVKAARGLADEDGAQAISGLGAGMAYLKPDQRAALVTAVTSMQQKHHAASAIEGLARGLEHLNPALRAALVDTVLSAPNSEIRDMHPAIGALGAELAHLSEVQQEALVCAATRFASVTQYKAIAGLGKAMTHLTPTQTQALLSAARAIEGDFHAAEALAGLAEGAAKLRPGPARAMAM